MDETGGEGLRRKCRRGSVGLCAGRELCRVGTKRAHGSVIARVTEIEEEGRESESERERRRGSAETACTCEIKV